MNTSEKINSIIPALIAVQAEVQRVGKGARNEHDGYDYARLEDYFIAVKSHLPKHELSAITSADEWERLPDRSGKMSNWVRVRLTLTLVHSSGQWVSVQSYGEGVDRGDKATYKAVTGARKYAMALLFDLVTSDDPESGEQAAPPVVITTDEAYNIQCLVDETGTDLGKFLEYFKVSAIAELTPVLAARAVKMLERKRT